MPVRSSVCTYSPSSLSATNSLGSKYSPSSLSIGQYKPLSSTPPLGRANNFVSSNYSASPSSFRSSSGSTTSGSRYTPTYSPSSFKSNPYSSTSLSSTGSTASSVSSSSASSSSAYSSSSPISGRYKPLNSSFSNRTATPNPARYSSASLGSNSSANEVLSSSGYHSPLASSSLRSSRFSPSTRRLSNSYSASSQNESLPAGVPRGLINLGNTCYMNSVLQALYSVESFRGLLTRASHDKILTSELSDLFKSMKNSPSPISPSNFKYAFSRYQAKFSGLGQQDAQEFLRYLINGVHEELNRVNSQRSRSAAAGAPRPPRSASEAWQQYRDIVDDSPLVDLLVGQLCSTIVCGVCSNKSHCWDPFWDLSLPLLVRGRYALKLADVVDEFLAKETLDSDERPVCECCKKATKSTKQISLARLPPVLILHLKKFTNEGYKLTSPDITIDSQLTFNRTTYHLKACISHHGHSSSSGHYTSHCEYARKWFHFNDDRVRDVTGAFDSSKLDDAYVLIYTQTASQQSKL